MVVNVGISNIVLGTTIYAHKAATISDFIHITNYAGRGLLEL